MPPSLCINGISSNEEVQGNMRFMREIEADLWGSVETNRPWTEDQKHKTGSQGRQIFNKFKVEAVSSDNPTIGQKQPGGACIGILCYCCSFSCGQGIDH
eukprot:13744957-Ditylum_brightwellii.AAC.1